MFESWARLKRTHVTFVVEFISTKTLFLEIHNGAKTKYLGAKVFVGKCIISSPECCFASVEENCIDEEINWQKIIF